MTTQMRLLSADFLKALEGYNKSVTLRLGTAFRRIGDDYVKLFTRERLRGRPGLIYHLGRFVKGLSVGVTGESELKKLGMVITLGGPVTGYAEIHEYGGDITPKKGAALAIPFYLGPAVTRGGDAIAPKDFGRPLFKLPGRPGGLYTKRGKTGIELVYVLKKRVHIPARLEFNKTFQREVPKMQGEMGEVLDSVAKDFNRG